MNNTLKAMLDPGAYVPVRAHEDDAGLDLISPVDVNIWTRGREAICTGVHVQIPKGYVGMITAKSGLMRDHGIITTGTSATISRKRAMSRLPSPPADAKTWFVSWTISAVWFPRTSATVAKRPRKSPEHGTRPIKRTEHISTIGK